MREDTKFMTKHCPSTTRALRRLSSVLAVPLAALLLSGTAGADGGQVSLAALEYREGHREAAIERRAEFMRRMDGGLAIITSADRSQPHL